MSKSSILAVDIGGTKTATALCHFENGQVRATSSHRSWRSREAASFDEIAEELTRAAKGPLAIEAVGIGVAGPITGSFPSQTAHVTNLSWELSAGRLSKIFGNIPVFLCNDMESHGWGLLQLSGEQRFNLNPAEPAAGSRVLIAAGTGLGESVIAWDGKRHIPLGGEGGHSAFSPSDDRDDRFLSYLRLKYKGHVSWERVLGGLDGFRNLSEFLNQEATTSEEKSEFKVLEAAVGGDLDWGKAVITLASAGQTFSNNLLYYYSLLYGREAANLALKCMPYNGVYVGGGIAPRIIPWLKNYFMVGFKDKGRFRGNLSNIPVYIIQEPENGLRGAAIGAWHQLHFFSSRDQVASP